MKTIVIQNVVMSMW